MSILTDPPPAMPHVALTLCQLAFGGLHGAFSQFYFFTYVAHVCIWILLWLHKAVLGCGAWPTEQHFVYHLTAASALAVSSKTALLYLPPFTFGALRVLLALPALWIFARAVEPGPHPCRLRDILVHLFLGITGITGPQGLIFVGVRLTSPDVVAIFQPTIPVWVALLTAVLGLEKFTFRKVLHLCITSIQCCCPALLDECRSRTRTALILKRCAGARNMFRSFWSARDA